MKNWEQTRKSAKILVKQHAKRAAWFIAENHDKETIDQQIHLARSDALDSHLEGTSSKDSEHFGDNISTTSSIRPTSPSRFPRRSQKNGMPTPPGTNSTKSGSERGGSQKCETRLVFNKQNQLEPVRYKRADTCCNWIMLDTVTRLDLEKSIHEGDIVTDTLFVGRAKLILKSYEVVRLIWCASEEEPTKSITCYVVDKNLGADILEGGQVFDDSEDMVNMPSSPSKAIQSGRAAQMGFGGTLADATETQSSSGRTTRPLNARGPGTAANTDQQGYHDFNEWRSSTGKASQASSRKAAPASSAMVSSLRIKVAWDGSLLPVKLDFNGSGENFLSQLNRSFTKRELDRNEFLLRLSTDRNPDAPSAEVAEVSFNENDLQRDWEDAINWIRDAKTDIYGRIEQVQANEESDSGG